MKKEPAPQKTKILIVDDNPRNIQIAGNILSSVDGYSLAFAKNGEKALRSARKMAPDLILLDIVMAGMDGYEVCETLKASPGTRDIPVIFMTAQRTEPEDLVRAFDAGAADYLAKPFHSAELLARVRTHIALKKAHEKLQKSEARYRAIVEDQTELICRFLPDATLVFVNEAFCRYFGKARGDLLETSFIDLMPENVRESVVDHLAGLSRSNPVSSVAHAVIRGGNVLWLQWTDRAIFDDKGGLTEIQAVGRDITDQVYAETAYRNLVDHSQQGMTIFQGLRCVFANRTMTEISGYTAAEMTAMRPEAVQATVHPADRDRILDILRDVQALVAEEIRTTGRFLRKDGVVKWLDLYFTAVDYWGAPSVQIVFMDITREKELESLFGKRKGFHAMVGASRPMQRVYTLIEQLAASDIPVLITGETGTGKELTADALHAAGDRGQGPLVRVNCSELPENLIESELFGHVRGAFTGADRDRVGRFQAADGGVLFLDEIGELPLHIQVKLLRAIEQKAIQRIGDARPRTVDIRLVAATNADLDERIADGRFRQDLFFRLKGAHIHLPPLRERGDDIPALFVHFADRFCDRRRRHPVRLREDVPPMLLAYPWPGNVRELKNAAQRACAVAPDAILTPDDLPPEVREQSSAPPAAVDAPLKDGAMPAEEREIRQALKAARWHKGNAARLLGIGRTTLYRKLAEYGIGAGDGGDAAD